MTCFWLFSGQWKHGGACQSTAGPQKEKDLWDPKMPLQEGKRNEKSAIAGLREEKAVPDPKKQKKRVWKVDFHESDPSRRKISLHNT